MRSQYMTTTEIQTYDDYTAKLAAVRSMMADRRSTDEIRKAAQAKYSSEKLSTDREFFDWLEKMNDYVQKYLKKYAVAMRKAKKTDEEISEELGRSVSYVRLLLSDSQQSSLDSGSKASVTASVADVRTQRALGMAEKNEDVTKIATELGVTANEVRSTYLGDAYLKKWAKRMADSNISVTTIASKIGNTESWVKTEALGAGYLKKWAIRLADGNNDVATIVTTLKSDNNTVKTTYLGTEYLKDWAKRLANTDTKSVASIKNTLDLNDTKLYTTDYVTKTLLGASYTKEWARRLFGKKTISQITVFLGLSNSDYVKNTLLGADFIQDYVVKAYAAASGKSVDEKKGNVSASTGLSKPDIQSYLDKNAAAVNRRTTLTEKIKNASTSMKSLNDKDALKKKRVAELVNGGSSMATIIKDGDLKKAYGITDTKKSLEASQILTLMGKEFNGRWAIKLSYSNDTIAKIITAMGATDAAKVKGYIDTVDKDFIKNWAVRKTSSNEATLESIANDLSVTGSTRKTTVKNDYIGNGNMKSWARRLFKAGKTVKEIYDVFGSIVSNYDIRTKYLGNDIMRDRIQSLIDSDNNSVLNLNTAKYMRETVFGVSSKDADYNNGKFIHDLLVRGENETPRPIFKNWAAALKIKKYTVSEIATHIGETQDYVRDKLLGNDIMTAWVKEIITGTFGKNYQSSGKQTVINYATYDGIKKVTGISAELIPTKTYISKRNFKSWAIRLTEYSTKNDIDSNLSAVQILVYLGTIGVTTTVDKKSTTVYKVMPTTVADLNKKAISTRKTYFAALHELLEYKYMVRWVKRLAKLGLSDKDVAEKIGLYGSNNKADTATVAKYRKAKDVLS